MGTETESILKLPLFSSQAGMKSGEYEQMLTPIHTLASIPFEWEEEPGKPRPCTHLIPHPHRMCLDPPPRLYNCMEKSSLSPTTVLDGPYITAKPRFFSFRLTRDRRPGSFDSAESAFVVGYNKKKVESKSWWRRTTGKRKVVGGDSASVSDEFCSMNTATLRRSGSFNTLSQPKSHIWATICEGFKQVIPWKSKNSKKQVLLA